MKEPCRSSMCGSRSNSGASERTEYPLDFPPDSVPIGLAQLTLEDLAAVLARQGGGEFDDPRDLVGGEPPAQEIAHRLTREHRARLRLDMGGERFAVFG